MNFFSRGILSDEAILSGIVSDGILQRNTENKLYEQYFYFIKDTTFKHKILNDEAASLYTDSFWHSLKMCVQIVFRVILQSKRIFIKFFLINVLTLSAKLRLTK